MRTKKEHKIILYSCRVSAGFPAPGDEHVLEGCMDLNRYLILRPASTFLARISGDSMKGAGIHDGDLAIVDRSIVPFDGAVVVAAVNGELTVKTFRQRGARIFLEPKNPDYPALEITPDTEMTVWGVVLTTIHTVNHHAK